MTSSAPLAFKFIEMHGDQPVDHLVITHDRHIDFAMELGARSPAMKRFI